MKLPSEDLSDFQEMDQEDKYSLTWHSYQLQGSCQLPQPEDLLEEGEEEFLEEMEADEELSQIIGLGVIPFINDSDSGPRAVSPLNSVPQSLSSEIQNAKSPDN